MPITDYYTAIFQPMTRQHYAQGGWYTQDGQRLTLDQALAARGSLGIHYPDDTIVFRGAQQRNMVKSYPPSLWAHGARKYRGGNAVNRC